MQKKYGFFDLDGTLLSETKKIPKNIFNSLKKFADDGNEIIICTGRWPLSANYFNKQIEAFNNKTNHYLISLNGAYIENLKTNKLIYHKPIREDVFEKLLMIHEKFKVSMWIYSKEGIANKIIYSTKIPFKKLVSKFNYGSVIEYNHNLHKNDEKYKILFMSLNDSKLNFLYSWLIENFSDYLTIIKTSKRNIEITANNVDKGEAVRFLQNLNNLNIDQLYSFGDSGNDVPMFKTTGYRFAFKRKNKQLVNLSNFFFKKNKLLGKVIEDASIEKYNYKFSNDNNLQIDFFNLESKFNLIEPTKQIYLWNYILKSNNITIGSINYPNWINKIIFRDFFKNNNLILKSNNGNIIFSTKEKKFIFAKSFSDTQTENLKNFIEEKQVKLFIFENQKGTYLIYDNEKLLNLFFKETKFQKSHFNYVIKQKLFNLKNNFKDVYSLSLYCIYPKDLKTSFKITKQNKLFHITSRYQKYVDESQYTKSFKVETFASTKEIFTNINNYLKTKIIK